jgi:hypothetical protein
MTLKRRPDADEVDLAVEVPSVHLGEKPMRLLSAAELGMALGVSEEVVLAKEAGGQLFSVAHEGPDSFYLAFQAWPEVSGQPLEAVLEALKVREHGGGAAYVFFVHRDDYLGYLTPVEALIGSVTSPQALEPWVVEGLRYPAELRLEAVLKAARNHASILDGW